MEYSIENEMKVLISFRLDQFIQYTGGSVISGSLRDNSRRIMNKAKIGGNGYAIKPSFLNCQRLEIS